MLVFFATYIGPLAGIATSLLWTMTSFFFTAAGRRLGPTLVNSYRIALAIVFLAITHRILAGVWIPQVNSHQVLLLALSGVIGLAIGDQALFTAFVDIGPRRSMLIMTTSPLFAAFFGWVALDEHLHGWAWLGIVLTIAGVAWVISERPRRSPAGPTPHFRRGIVLALVGSACQAGGLLLSKQGMGHGWASEEQFITPQTATLVRMFFAGLGMIPILWMHTYLRKKRVSAVAQIPQPGSRGGGYLFATAGAFVGPFLGVWMSLVASDRAPLGIAQTLCSLTPIFILPLAARIHKEHIGYRAVLGSLVAVGGAALLFFQVD